MVNFLVGHRLPFSVSIPESFDHKLNYKCQMKLKMNIFTFKSSFNEHTQISGGYL